VIHDTWATRPGSVMVTLRGSRTSHDVTVTVQTLAEVRQLAGQLAGAAHELGPPRPPRSAPTGPVWRISYAWSSGMTSTPARAAKTTRRR
jgi:hypothetical protein